MSGNSVVLEFAGDATKLAREAKKAEQAVGDFGDATRNASTDVEAAQAANDKYMTRLDHLGGALDTASSSFSGIGDAAQAFADFQSRATDKMQKHERATQGVKQAQEDYNQALQDGKQAVLDSAQAEIDLEQAQLDKKKAQDEYNDAVAKYGKNSDEARQAAIDLKQADQDVNQSLADKDQALRDNEQSAIDAKDAQLDMNDATKEANPSELQKVADTIAEFAPLLTGLLTVYALVTTAQTIWNLAMLASPMTWIILAILGIIAVIAILVIKWDWVKEVAGKAWKWIKDKAKDVWDWLKELPGKLKDKFSSIGDAISKPFKAAFNAISDAWNNTVGNLSWTLPDWIPGIGGNTISAPRLPKFHDGGTVPGAPGSEMLAILQAGERVIPANQNGGDSINLVVRLDSNTLVNTVIKGINRRGGINVAVQGGYNV